MLMKIVFNSSPLIFLTRLGFLQKAVETFEHCYLPKYVEAEIGRKQDEARDVVKNLITSHTLEVRGIALISLANKLSQRLGRGESEAIALAMELQADYVILDDAAARKEAMRLGVNVKGTLGITRKLHSVEKIRIEDLEEFYKKLRAIQFRVKRKIFDEIFKDQ